MAELSGAEALLLEMLGMPFLCFVLNAEESEIEKRLRGDEPLLAQQETTLSELISFLGTLPHTDPFSAAMSLSILGQHNPSLGASWPIAARINAGGTVELPPGADAVTNALLGLIRDAYPLFLLPPIDEPFAVHRTLTTVPLFKHPQKTEFEAAVMDDPTLARLFPNDDPHAGRHGSVYRSTGAGGGIQLALFADLLLNNGWRYATRAGEPVPIREFAERTFALVDLIKKAISGEPLQVPAYVGITGVRLPAGMRIEMPWGGQLREVTAADQRHIPKDLAGKLTMTHPDGSNVEIDYAGDLVMELDVPYKIKLDRFDDRSRDWPIKPLTSEAIFEHVETLSLALLLSWDESPRPIVVNTWMVTLDPLEFGVGMSWRESKRLPLIPTVLTDEQADKWKTWTVRVADGRIPSIGIAIRRTLLAAVERADATDALVDAVIALENLVGSSEGESRLRVSAALAWLLGSDAAEREKIRVEVADLYALRSKVVHGGAALKPNEAVERRTQALDLALDAFRKLLGDRTDLLKSCKTSTERSVRLILDGDQ